MAEFEVRYKRNRSLFANGSAPQLTIMGTNKYNPDVKYVPPKDQEEVVGILG